MLFTDVWEQEEHVLSCFIFYIINKDTKTLAIKVNRLNNRNINVMFILRLQTICNLDKRVLMG